MTQPLIQQLAERAKVPTDSASFTPGWLTQAETAKLLFELCAYLDEQAAVPPGNAPTALEEPPVPGMASCGHGYASGSLMCPQCHPTADNITYLVNQDVHLREDLDEAREALARVEADNASLERETVELIEAAGKRSAELAKVTAERDAAQSGYARVMREWKACETERDAMKAVVDAARQVMRFTFFSKDCETIPFGNLRMALSALDKPAAAEVKCICGALKSDHTPERGCVKLFSHGPSK